MKSIRFLITVLSTSKLFRQNKFCRLTVIRQDRLIAVLYPHVYLHYIDEMPGNVTVSYAHTNTFRQRQIIPRQYVFGGIVVV